MSLPEIVAWTAVSAFLVIRIAMLGMFVAIPVMIVRGIYHKSAA